jgi:hypothetical protein
MPTFRAAAALKRTGLGGLLALSALAGAAHAQPPERGRWVWTYGGPEDRGAYRLVGPGVPELVPELRDSRRGRAFVMRNFDFDGDGVISVREARAADRAFLDYAGRDRARFDWEHPHRWDAPPPPPPAAAPAPPPPAYA